MAYGFEGGGHSCYSPTAAVAMQSLQRVLVAHDGDVGAAGGCAIALLLLRVGLAGGRTNDDGWGQAALTGVVGGQRRFLGACRLRQLAATRAELAKLEDLLQAKDALGFLLWNGRDE